MAMASASAQTAYDFTADFNRVPAGTAFSADQQKRVWKDPDVKWHWNGMKTAYSIVAEGKNGGNCMQIFYPKGEVGATHKGETRDYQLIAAPTDVLNVEWDWQFKPGFDFHSQGKIAPAVRVKNNSGVWIGLRWYWYYSAPLPNPGGRAHPVLHAENNTTGATIFSAYTSPRWDFQAGVWYHFHLQYAPGPQGWLKGWIQRPNDAKETLTGSYGAVANTTSGSPFMLSFSTFFGGAGPAVAARTDSYALIDNIHIYSGR